MSTLSDAVNEISRATKPLYKTVEAINKLDRILWKIEQRINESRLVQLIDRSEHLEERLDGLEKRASDLEDASVMVRIKEYTEMTKLFSAMQKKLLGMENELVDYRRKAAEAKIKK